MPEVNRSFYTDMAYGPEYFTYITEELPGLCESMFHISTSSEDRYIAGMSMGGYGCLKAALSHPECYTGCAAISAVTNIHTKIESTPDSAPKKTRFPSNLWRKLTDFWSRWLIHTGSPGQSIWKTASRFPSLLWNQRPFLPRKSGILRFSEKAGIFCLFWRLDWNTWLGLLGSGNF